MEVKAVTMLKKELKTHYLVALIWLTIISLLRLVGPGWSLVSLIFFWLGGLVGTFLFDVDHLVYTLLIYPGEPTSLKVRELFRQGHWRQGLTILVETYKERIRLPFHNALFQVVFWVFCFWVLTSTNSWLGRGLVMSMALHLLKDELHLLLVGRDEQLHRWLWWLLRQPVSLGQQRFFVILMLLIFLGLNLFLI